MSTQFTLFCFVVTVLMLVTLNSNPAKAAAVGEPVQIDVVDVPTGELEIEMPLTDEALPLAYQRVKRGSCSYGRGACVASCWAQDCGTGYCHSGSRGICSCSRCGRGGYSRLFGRK